MIAHLSAFSRFAGTGQYWDTVYTATVLAAVIVAAVLVFALIKSIQLRLKPPQVAPLVEGEKIVSVEDAKPGEEVFVMYRGEYWKARSPKGIAKGRPYRISGKDGATLILEPLE